MQAGVFCPFPGCGQHYTRWHNYTKHIKRAHNLDKAASDPTFIKLPQKDVEGRSERYYWYTQRNSEGCIKHRQLTVAEVTELEDSQDLRKVRLITGLSRLPLEGTAYSRASSAD